MPPPGVPPPDVVVFGLFGTLFSLAGLEPRLAKLPGATSATLGSWIAQTHADGFSLAIVGGFKTWKVVAKAALQQVLPKADAKAVDRVVAGFSSLDAFPDAGPAMGRIVMDARPGVVTNAGSAIAKALMKRGELDTFADTVVTADDVKAWKPTSAPYRRAAQAEGVTPDAVALVSAHPWDIHGAKRAGLRAGWCNRDGAPYPATFDPPDVTGDNLLAVVEALFA